MKATEVRKWHQFGLLHLILAITVFGVASYVLRQVLTPTPAAIEGQIAIDGVPLSDGIITIEQTKPGTKNRISQRIVNGAYSYPGGVSPGRYLVEISAPKQIGTATVESLPAHYNQSSVLSLELESGTNVADFNLSVE